MVQTEHYKFKQYEGTDIFNPLTVEAQNIQDLDETIYDVSVTGVPTATELKSGTIHALTRKNIAASMFRFVATAKWEEGDTCTVDGVQVSTLLPNGEALPAGAWQINSNVLCIVVGTVLTVFTSVPTGGGALQIDATTLDGHTADYFAIASETPAKSQGSAVQLGVGLWGASGDLYTQSVSVANVTTSAPNVIVSPSATSWQLAVDNNVRCTAQGSGILTFTADSVPNATVYMNVVLVF